MRNDTMIKWLSRKFLLTVLSLIVYVILLCYGFINGWQYVALFLSTLFAYLYINYIQKIKIGNIVEAELKEGGKQ
jgi:hypothetical protein